MSIRFALRFCVCVRAQIQLPPMKLKLNQKKPPQRTVQRQFCNPLMKLHFGLRDKRIKHSAIDTQIRLLLFLLSCCTSTPRKENVFYHITCFTAAYWSIVISWNKSTAGLSLYIYKIQKWLCGKQTAQETHRCVFGHCAASWEGFLYYSLRIQIGFLEGN